MTYILFYISIYISGYFDFVKRDRRLHWLIFGIAFLVLWTFAGFRYQTGWDWPVYQKFFDTFSTDEPLLKLFANNMQFEPGFILLCYIVKVVGGNIQVVFATLAFFTVGLLALSLRKYTPYVLIALLVYLYNGYILNFGYIRQGIAISIFFFAIRYIESRNPIAYFSLFVLAFLLHNSSILFIPFYFLLHKNYTKKVVVLSVVACFVLLQLKWMDLFMDILNSILGGSFIFAKFYRYYNIYAGIASVKVGLSAIFLERLALFAFLTYHKEFFQSRMRYFNIFYNLLFGYFCMYLLFNNIVLFVERVGLFFDVANVFCYSCILLKFSTLRDKIAVYNVLAVLIFLRLFRFFFQVHPITGGIVYEQYYPYKNYLFHLLGIY